MTEPPEPGYDEFLDFNAPLSDGRADAIGLGVDTDARVIERAQANAAHRGLAERVTFTVEPAGATAEPADVVICVGSDHAYGERQDAALKALHDLDGLVDLTIAAGYRPLFIQTANRDEWEQFEAGYLADWETWLVQYGDHPTAGGVREQSDRHRNEWLHGWRNVLGFAYLTLGRPAG